jgi:DNA polymerase III subunit beta
MEFLTDLNLTTALSFAGKAVSSKPTHPVLSGVLIESGDGKLCLSGFDLSVGAKVTIAADVVTPGSMVVPYKLLMDLVSRINAPIHFTQEGDRVLVLKTNTGVYRINCFDPSEFPVLFEVNPEHKLTIGGEALARCFDVGYAASHDESKQVLQGINLTDSGSGAKFAATDGHRLVVKEYRQDGEIGIESINIPSSLSPFLRHVNPSDEVTIAYSDGMALLKWGNYELTTRLLDGTYPDYERLFPTSFARSARFDKKTALQSLNRVMVMDEARVILNIEAGKIVFSVDSEESGAKESIDATVEGDPIEIPTEMCLNPKYLTDALKHQEGETIVFNSNSPTSPIVITSEGFTQRTLMMPIQIRK